MSARLPSGCRPRQTTYLQFTRAMQWQFRRRRELWSKLWGLGDAPIPNCVGTKEPTRWPWHSLTHELSVGSSDSHIGISHRYRPATASHTTAPVAPTNPLWGAPRIHGELLKLGIDIGETSVSKYLVRSRKPPS